jgi:transcriptional regulator with XRE-family HTH domain
MTTKHLTVNQVVAYNLRRAREERGWTQDEAAERLEHYLQERWSRATFSRAERTIDVGARVREFTANEIVAFAVTFGVPLTWFFVPPPGDPTIYMTEDARVVIYDESDERAPGSLDANGVSARELRRALTWDSPAGKYAVDDLVARVRRVLAGSLDELDAATGEPHRKGAARARPRPKAR